MALPPVLSAEDRAAALAVAAANRKVRAAFKESVRSGQARWTEALDSKNEAIRKMRIKELIESIPGFGELRARAVLDRIGISHTRRVQGLGKTQRYKLIQELGNR